MEALLMLSENSWKTEIKPFPNILWVIVDLEKREKQLNAGKKILEDHLVSEPAPDAPGSLPEGPPKALTSGTYTKPSQDSRGINAKIDDLIIKLYFSSNSPCIT